MLEKFPEYLLKVSKYKLVLIADFTSPIQDSCSLICRPGKDIVVKDRKFSILIRSYSNNLYKFFAEQTQPKMIAFVATTLSECVPLFKLHQVRYVNPVS